MTILGAAAEDAGRDAEWRGGFDLVTARSFGAPAVVAECGAPFLRVGGRLVVSEPPSDGPTRWPVEGLAAVGLEDLGSYRTEGGSVRVHPTADPLRSIDLKQLADDLQARGIMLPLLIRFRDILKH